MRLQASVYSLLGSLILIERNHMKKIFPYIVVALLSACAMSPDVTQGERVGSDAIVIARFNILPANSPVLVKVSQTPLFGPVGSFKVENGNSLAVTTLMPGRYNWGDILNVRYTRPIDASGVLPPFEAKSGCISYIGDVTLDFSGPRARVFIEQPSSSTLDEFASQYPKLFAAHAVCK